MPRCSDVPPKKGGLGTFLIPLEFLSGRPYKCNFGQSLFKGLGQP